MTRRKPIPTPLANEPIVNKWLSEWAQERKELEEALQKIEKLEKEIEILKEKNFDLAFEERNFYMPMPHFQD
jgi:hypothetical protein